MNEPYVKKYVGGVLQNPITSVYVSSEPTRHQRRMREPRFTNNRNTCHIVVVGNRKYKMVLDRQKKKDGSILVNKHYL